MYVRALSLFISVLVWSCACGSTQAPARSSAPPSSSPSMPGTPSYVVHEWGLVRAGAGDTLEVGALGPGAPSPADFAVIEKPVLYFHLEGEGALDVSVGVRAGEGEIREHWPVVREDAAPHELTWASARLHGGPCPMPAIASTTTSCARLDPGEACETLELARALALGTACVTVSDRAPVLDVPFLFYRVRTRALRVPLAPAYLDFGDINVRNDSDLPMPGRLIRFQRVLSTVRVVVVDPPAPHATILVGHDSQGPEVARVAVRDSLTGIGLTDDEASAFLASWDEAFFGGAASEHERTPAAEEIPPPEDSILYFLPEADVARLAELELTPAPSAVHRAMAVWTTLR